MYKIVRHYFNGGSQGSNGGSFHRTIKTRLTLEEAQAHCKDPQTHSKECTTPAGKRRTKKYGMWFDGYEET